MTMMPARVRRKAGRPTRCRRRGRPIGLEEEERAEDEAADDEGEDGDADEAPEVEQALLEEGAEAGGGVGLVAEEGSGDEEEVDDEEEGDGGVSWRRFRRLRWGLRGGAGRFRLTVPRSKPLERRWAARE